MANILTVPPTYVYAQGWSPEYSTITPSQSFVTINGHPIVIDGDVVEKHVSLLAAHDKATVVATGFVTISKNKIAVAGDSASSDASHVLQAKPPPNPLPTPPPPTPQTFVTIS